MKEKIMALATTQMVNEPSEKNKQLVRGLYEAFKRGDIGTLLAGLTSNVEWITPGPSEIPLSGRRTGREEVSQFFQLLSDEEEIQEFVVEHYLADNNIVAALGRYRAKVRATGRTTASSFVHIFAVVNGKVSRFEEFFDTAGALLARRPY
jgi:ketosteroid isomerase-like protein